MIARQEKINEKLFKIEIIHKRERDTICELHSKEDPVDFSNVSISISPRRGAIGNRVFGEGVKQFASSQPSTG